MQQRKKRAPLSGKLPLVSPKRLRQARRLVLGRARIAVKMFFQNQWRKHHESH